MMRLYGLHRKQLAELSDVGVPAISKHLKNIFDDGNAIWCKCSYDNHDDMELDELLSENYGYAVEKEQGEAEARIAIALQGKDPIRV